MASNREMRAIGRDAARVRSLILGLLKLAETAENIFTDWELTFLRSLVGQAESRRTRALPSRCATSG